ncbi:MAG: acetate kinase [Verrucomicrobiae bacterium]|nr:acetate kinase [Verrucomicrobiae bacterium]
MKILVANLGSTSLKYRLFDFSDGRERMLARGGFERLTDHGPAIEACLAELRAGGWMRDASDLAAVGFKVVMARGLNGCVRLDAAAIEAMEAFNAVAPAHNPPYVNGIRKFARRMPKTPLIGLFETAFYQWTPEAAMRYGIPEEWHDLGVRRWGFHGASHKFIAERSAEILGREDVAARVRDLYVDGETNPVREPALRVISCHLGGSTSISGIRNGLAIGNSLGMSPQSGVLHNNRVGDLDAFALPYVMRATGMTMAEAERILCKDSGLKGVSGGHSDMRDLSEAAAKGDARAKLALEMFVHQTRHWIGAFFAELNGLDALVFTGGIGENQANVREMICRDLDALGLALDPDANAKAARGAEASLGVSSARAKTLVIPTNEELVVAREARRLLLKKNPSLRS